MEYLTDREHATSCGSGKSRTHRDLPLQISAVALAVLVVLIVVKAGSVLTFFYPEFTADLSRPFPSIAVALTIVGITYLMTGIQTMIADDTRRGTGRAPIIGVACHTCTASATGHFAPARPTH